MLLLINNAKPFYSYLSYIQNLRSSLRFNKILFQETDRIDPKIDKTPFQGIVISGSPMQITKPALFSHYSYIMHYLMAFQHLPVLGIGFGYHFLAQLHGLEIENKGKLFCESNSVNLLETHPLFLDMPKIPFHPLHFCFSDLATVTPTICKKYNIQDIAWVRYHHKKRVCAIDFGNHKYGCLFHPEYSTSSYSILNRFYNICLSAK
jgi:GMP synthase-like glutamine amidotransferase